MHNRNSIIFTIVGFLLIAITIACVVLLRPDAVPSAEEVVIQTATSTDSTSTSTGSITSEDPPVMLVEGSTNIVAPDYTRALIFSVSTNESLTRSQFATAQAAIKANKYDFDGWVLLGAMRKQAGDYKGAETDWQYVSKLYPANPVSFANLADLYHFFLKDYSKAAAAYEQAIKNNPKQVYLFENFYLLSNEYPAAGSKVVTAFSAAIKQHPEVPHLQLWLARYYKSVGQKDVARATYIAAANVAESQNQSDFAATIRAEAATL